jgi:hypothetical protein
VDHVADVALVDPQQTDDRPYRLALAGHEHHDRPAQLHRILLATADPGQPPTLLHRQFPYEHIRLPRHDHLHKTTL